jgi:protein involved in polysaccharide export with SLBB domain
MNSRLISRILIVCISVIAGLQSGCETTGTRRLEGGEGAKVEWTRSEYRAGDKILIDFADNPGIPPSWQQTVREDGTIGLPFNQVVRAEGKKKIDLEQAIHDLYVPKILKRLTVNIRAETRYFYVTGEVKNPGQKDHTTLISVMKAISAAGDFTDFADKGDIDVFRSDGEIVKVNGKDILNGTAKDVPVYPGDRVHVNRRFF